MPHLPATPPSAVRRQVTAVLGSDAYAERDDLFERGLDSLGLIRLVGRWREDGHAVTFEDLAAEPTLEAWQRLLGLQREEAAVDPAPPAARTAPAPAASGPRAAEAPFPLATMQHAYWVGRGDEQPLGGVAAHFYTEFDGVGLDPGRLREALAHVVGSHPMLRVRIDPDGRQRCAGPGPALRIEDLRGAGADDVARRLGTLREEGTHRRMDLASEGPLDVLLTLLPGGRTRLHVDLDMVAADALSLRVLLEDLAAAYAGAPRPAPGYDVATALRDRVERRAPEIERARAWWEERLAEIAPAPALPTVLDAVEPTPAGTPAARSTRLHHALAPERTARFGARARAAGVTPAAALATAFAETMARWSAEPRFSLNLPLFDRAPLHPEVERVVGDFSSSVLLTVDASGPLTVAERARTIQRDLHAAVDHGAYGGVEVLRDLARLHGRPVVPSPVVYTSAIGLGPLFGQDVQRILGAPAHIISQGPQVWLDAQVTELDGGLLLNWDLREHAFLPGTARAAFEAYRGLVDALVDDPEAWHRPAPDAVPPEALSRRARPALEAPAPASRTLHAAFLDRARSAPEALAVVEPDGAALTYGELAGRALRVAGAVSSAVPAGALVAISADVGADRVAAILGVLAAGCAYLPLGHQQPSERRLRILREGSPALLITDLDAAAPLPVLPLADALAHPAAEPRAADPADLAYVLFTSGSTGTPKGVEVPHAAAAHTVDVLARELVLGPADRTLGLAEADFDMSVLDLFAPLSTGGAVVLVAAQDRPDAARWARAAADHGVTVVNCVPTLLDLWLSVVEAGEAPAPSLRAALLGGDRIASDLVGRLRAAAPEARFMALGGTTEAAIHSTLLEVREADPAWDAVPWGRPLPGVRCRVADGDGRDRPDGVPGELWIGGAGLARGYRGAPDLTGERFVEARGERWYRTGDLARYDAAGSLHFVGRADHRVKVGGVRIELGEVEAALASHPRARAAVAVVLEDPAPRLAAAVLAGDGVAAAELRAHAAERLPAAMLPASIRTLPDLPLTPNAKPDRAAVARLLAEEAGRAEDGPAAPGGDREVELAALWEELLGISGVSRDDSFFARGGDSLLATRLVAALRARGRDGVGVGTVFRHPMLADLAARLDDAGPAAPDAPVPGPAPAIAHDASGRHEPFPLTGVQRAYLTGRDPAFVLGGAGTSHYTEFDAEDLDLARLARALDRLTARHDMLRAVLDADGSQRVLPEVPPVRVPVAEADPADPEGSLAAFAGEMAQRVLDPARWPLFEVRALRYRQAGRERTRLGIVLDYLVLDALSIMTFYRELQELYLDPDAGLPPLGITFRDCVLASAPDPALERRAFEHWRRRVEELPPAPALPLAVDPATVGRPRFTRRSEHLGPAEWTALAEVARGAGLTASSLLLAGYGEVLAAWSGRTGVAITLTLFNRPGGHPDLERVLGDFTSLSLAGYDRAPGASPLEAARRLHERLGEDLDHREVSAERVLRDLSRREGAAEAGVPVVFTGSLGLGDGRGLDPLRGFATRVGGLSQSPQVHLDNQVLESRGGLDVSWDAVEELFLPGVLDAMFGAYLALLRRLAREGVGAWEAAVADLLPAEQRRRREEIDDAAASGTAPAGLLHHAFMGHAVREPHVPALLDAEGTLTRGEVRDRALRIAAGLLARGVEAGDAVAVHLPKGADQVCAAIGILAAGAAYVPVGVSQPLRRRERIHAAAGTVLSVGVDPSAPASCAVAELLDRAPLPGPVPVAPDGAAYIVFTSGSTGEPKGVEVSHAAALNTVADVVARYRVGPGDRVLALSALDFDLSVFDVFGVLGAGGALVLPREEERTDAHRWLALCREHGVTLWNTVPALLDLLLLAAGEEQLPEGLYLALVSGDWVGTDLAGRLERATARRARLVALGGATEAAIWSNAHDGGRAPTGWPSVPYGLPLSRQRFRVVDPHGRDCPDGVPGELWIGGAGLARGYRGDPERTAERFPEGPDGRWYRTGDLGRYREGGLLEFIGRVDRQVKVGGHRLELGEVEAALREHPAVGRAAVLAVGGRGDRRLVGFLTPADGALGDDAAAGDRAATGNDAATGDDAAGEASAIRPLDLPADLDAHLRERVAPHAVPGVLRILPALPLTPNGKVDRPALETLAGELLAEHDAPAEPADDVERRLADLWSRILGAPVADRAANFFALGGTSLLALRMITEIRGTLHPGVSTRAFLAEPTLRALADQLRGVPDDDAVVVGTI